MQISAKNQILGIVTSVMDGQSYSQIAVEQTDADGKPTGSFIHAAIPVDIPIFFPTFSPDSHVESEH